MATQVTLKSSQNLLGYGHLWDKMTLLFRPAAHSCGLTIHTARSCDNREHRDLVKCARSGQYSTQSHRHHSSDASSGSCAAVCSRRHTVRTGFKLKMVDRFLSSQSPWQQGGVPCRSFVTSGWTGTQLGFGGSSPDQPSPNGSQSPQPYKDWALRLANENGYLSWCRNSYLTTVVALAIIGEDKTIFAEQAAEGALFVAGLNLTWGTYQYIYNMVRQRRAMGVTMVGVMLYSSFALLHLALWFMVCAVFMGYAEDPDLKSLKEEAGKVKTDK